MTDSTTLDVIQGERQSKDVFGDRMKLLEGLSPASGIFIPQLPVVCRVDGRGFSRLTRNLARPYDERLSRLMVRLTELLVHESNAVVGYTQSDEISLVLCAESFDQQLYFGGKVQKIVSLLAAFASVKFNALLPEHGLEEMAGGTFDCRAYNTPNLDEAANALLWREKDATKNSVSMAARCYYSHKQLHGKSRAEQMDLLMVKGVNWSDYPTFFKRGTYVKRVKSAETERSSVEVQDFPPLTSVTHQERLALLFGGTLLKETP